MDVLRSALVGTAAGAVGTVALNIASYADVAARGRPASEMPATLVKNLAESAGIAPLAADDETAGHRREGVGALLGYANGLAVGAAYGTVRPVLGDRVPLLLAALAAAAAAMALSDVPATKTGATDPSTWGVSGWVADVVPHLCFGVALAWAFDALTSPDAR